MYNHEENLSTQKENKTQGTRLPQAYGFEVGSQRAFEKTQKGQKEYSRKTSRNSLTNVNNRTG